MRRDLSLASAAVVAAMLVAAAVLAPGLPPGARLPVHWNAAGVADGFAAPWTALLALPAVTAATAAVLALLPRFDPRVLASAGLYRAAWAGTLLVLGVADLAIVAAARGGAIPRGMHVAALGVLLVVVGNQLGKSRPTRLIGIRTPWTLADPDTWTATHRLGGRLMLAAGLLCLAFVAAGAPPAAMPWLLAAIALSAVAPVGYSYLDWSRRRPH